MNGLGLLQLRRHHPADARALFEETLASYAALGDDRLVPVVQANLALAFIDLGEFQQADDLLQTILAAFRERGDVLSEGNALRLLSAAQRGLGNVPRALDAARDAIELAVRQGNTLREAYWLLDLGAAQRLAGDLDAALASYQRSAQLQHGLGHKVREAQARDGEGVVQRELGNLGQAIALHRHAAEAFRTVNARWLLAVALGHLAAALNASGQPGDAREQAAEALRLLDEFTDPAAEHLKATLRALP